MFNLFASSSTVSFVNFNFFNTSVYLFGLFPFGSLYSYIPLVIRSSIVPYGVFSHTLHNPSFTFLSHCVYKPWFFTIPLQQFSFFSPLKGIGYLLFSTFFSFFTSIFNALNASSTSKLYNFPHSSTAFFTLILILFEFEFVFVFDIDIDIDIIDLIHLF